MLSAAGGTQLRLRTPDLRRPSRMNQTPLPEMTRPTAIMTAPRTRPTLASIV